MLSVVGVTLRTNTDIAFRCAYQLVGCSKYRRKVIGGRMEVRLKEVIAEVIAERGAWLIEMETMPDRVRVLVEVDPQFGVHRLVKAIKGRSSLVLREEFPWLKSKLGVVEDELVFRGDSWGAPLSVVSGMSRRRRIAESC